MKTKEFKTLNEVCIYFCSVYSLYKILLNCWLSRIEESIESVWCVDWLSVWVDSVEHTHYSYNNNTVDVFFCRGTSELMTVAMSFSGSASHVSSLRPCWSLRSRCGLRAITWPKLLCLPCVSSTGTRHVTRVASRLHGLTCCVSHCVCLCLIDTWHVTATWLNLSQCACSPPSYRLVYTAVSGGRSWPKLQRFVFTITVLIFSHYFYV